MPITHNQRLFLAVQTYFILLMLYIMQLGQLRHRILRNRLFAQAIESSRAFNEHDAITNADVEALALATIYRPSIQSCWMKLRSSHWIKMVINEEILLGKEFESNFRMTRNSFDQLHAVLGNELQL